MKKLLAILTLTCLICLVGRFALAGEAAAPAAQPAAASAAQPTAAPPMSPEDKADAEIGKSAAAEVEKHYKIVKDSPDVPRLNAIIAKLKPVTQKPNQVYTVKVIDSRAINAFSLPGGYLFFTQGLLDAVESDDELAAVTGHEMGHVCLNHSRKQMSRSDRYTKLLGPLVLASILTRSDRVDPGAMLMVGSMVMEDALNHYGQAAEFEADHNSVLYLYNSKAYNPVAMLTVTEGLAHMESGELQINMGVEQTHPMGPERVAAVEKELNDLGVPIERRRVTKSLYTTAGAVKVKDGEIVELKMIAGGGDKPWTGVIFRPAVTVDGASPLSRAQDASKKINDLLLVDLNSLEIMAMTDGTRGMIQARGQTLFTITPEDAAFHKTTVDALARQAIQTMRAGFQQERVGRAY